MRDPGRFRVAIVLGVMPYGDADRVVRLLSPEEGRLTAFQRGGQRKPIGLDVGVRACLQLRARDGGMDTLMSAEVEEARIHLRRRYDTLVLAQYTCELVGAFAREGHPEAKLFGLAETMLLLLDSLQGAPGSALLPALELKVLTFAGVAPRLDRCVGCGGAPDAELVFDAADGGLRHARCGGGTPVSAELAAALEGLRRASLRDLVDASAPDEAGALTYGAVTAQLGRALGARALLAGLH